MRLLVNAFCLAIFLWGIGLQAASFTASVDKIHVKTGEPLTLTLTYHGQTEEEPDISALEREFSVVSRQVSQQSTMMRGNFQAKTIWSLEIFPKSSEKNITIPSVTLGKHTTKTIKITQSEQAVSGQEGVTLTLTTDRDMVYVNGELILRLEIKTALPLRNGSLSKPEIKDAIIEPLLSDEQREVVEQGIKYHVFTKIFAVYPAKEGVLVIPPFIFGGVVSRSRAQGGWPDFFASGQRISARSQERTVTVKGVPKEYPPNHPFLPLKSFVVIESFDEANPQFEVNKAFARRFEMKAKGTLASFLPNLTQPVVDKVSIYPEEGQKSQTNLEDGIEAQRTFSHIYMPSAPGDITVPEQTIYWWDVDSDKLKTTTIRALEMKVAGDVVPTPPPAPPQEASPITNEEQASSEPLRGKVSLIWLLWIIVVLCATYASWRLWALWQIRYQESHPAEVKLKSLLKNIRALCDKGDARGVYKELQSLKDWAIRYQRVDALDATILGHIKTLEDTLFSGHTHEQLAPQLLALKQRVARIKAYGQKTANGLASLYPQ